MRALLEDLGATPDELAAIYYVQPDGPPDETDIGAMVAAGVTLTIVDAAAGAYDVSELDDNKRQDAERFASAWIKPLWQRGVTTLLLDHLTKNSDARGKFAIGSERKIGQADVHLGLEVVTQLHRGSDGLIRVKTHKDRRGYLPRPTAAELHLRSDPDTHAISWAFKQASEVDGWRPTVLMEKVSRWLEQQAEPVSRNAVEKAKLGRSAEHVRQAMDALIADGYAVETPGPHNARLLGFVRCYSTSSDLVPTSSDEDTVSSSTSSSAYRRDEDEDEDEDEVTDGLQISDEDREWWAAQPREATA